MLMPVGKDADHAQHRHADHLPGTTHAQGEAIEVDINRIEVSENASATLPGRPSVRPPRATQSRAGRAGGSAHPARFVPARAPVLAS